MPIRLTARSGRDSDSLDIIVEHGSKLTDHVTPIAAGASVFLDACPGQQTVLEKDKRQRQTICVFFSSLFQLSTPPLPPLFVLSPR